MTQETFPMIVGGEETLNERTLLTQVESGLMNTKSGLGLALQSGPLHRHTLFRYPK
jgi:hypothetical protein